MKLAGEDGNLTKENFVKILKSSDFFMKSFDKNKDGVVTEVSLTHEVNFSESIILDRHDDPGRAGLQCPGQGQEGLHHCQGAHEAY